MDLDDSLIDVPEGKFSLIGKDSVNENYFKVGDYDSKSGAIEVARLTSVLDIDYYVVDDKKTVVFSTKK